MVVLISMQVLLVAGLLIALVWSLYESGREQTIFIVSLSSGVSSAVAAERTIAEYGAGNVVNVFMDTLVEDDDNYRFLDELAERFGGVVRIVEGRTPLQVAEDENIIPNQKIAPCTKRLKIIPFLRYVERWQRAGYQPVVMLGFSWDEMHRTEAPTRNYGERGIITEYPLLWKPYDTDMFATVRSWDIEPPRMYGMGFPHGNCGKQGCVKQGKRDWKRTYTYFPVAFNTTADWETSMRQDERFSDYAFLRHTENGVTRAMSLREFEQTLKTEQMPLFPAVVTEEDLTNCFCNAGDPGGISND